MQQSKHCRPLRPGTLNAWPPPPPSPIIKPEAYTLQFTDMLALCGDASDNVPGVRGIGPKTAAPLLQQYGDVEGVLAAAAEVHPLFS